MQGMARVVVLDRTTGATFTEDIGDDNPIALYIPGRHAHGFEALTDLLFVYHVTQEYDAADPDEHGIPWDDPRVKDLWSTATPTLSARTNRLERVGRRVLITGAGGQLGAALATAFAADDVDALARGVGRALPGARLAAITRHRASYGSLDERRRGGGRPAGRGRGERGRHDARSGARSPLVAYSSDYVFDGRKGTPYVESDSPSPLSAYGMTKLHGEAAAGERAWVIRSSWLFGATGHNFVRTMLRLGSERDEVAVVADQRGCPTYVGHLAAATRELVDAGRRSASGTSRPAATAPGPISPRQSSRRQALDCRVRRITTAEFGARAPRPAVSILRSEKGAPELPHWREGLSDCLAAIARTRA